MGGRDRAPAVILQVLVLACLWQSTPAQDSPDYTALNDQYRYQTLGVCGGAKWHRTVITNSPADDPSYFANISNWDNSQYSDWVKNRLAKKWVVSAVFLGLGVLTALIFLIWRLVHYILVCCRCGCCGHRHERSEQFMTDGKGRLTGTGYDDYHYRGRCGSCWKGCLVCAPSWNKNACMAVLKPLILLLALATAAFCVYGLTQARQGYADTGWEHVDTVRDYVNNVTYHVDWVLGNISTLNAAVTTLQDAVPQVDLPIVGDTPLNAIRDAGDTIKAALNGVLQDYGNQTAQARDQVVGKIQNIHDNYYGTSQDLDRGQHIVALVLFIVGLAVLLLLAVAVLWNIPALLMLLLLLSVALMLLYFLVPLAEAIALSAGRDVCPSVETIAKSFLPEYEIMENYYFFNAGGSLEQALKANGIIDVITIDQQVQAVQGITDQVAPYVSQVPTLGDAFQQAQTSITNSVNAENELKAYASYAQVNPIYTSAKTYACCDVTSYLYKLWIAFTGAGWGMMVLIWLAALLMGSYDRTPGVHHHCGWTCLGPFPHGDQQQPYPQAGGSPYTPYAATPAQTTPGGSGAPSPHKARYGPAAAPPLQQVAVHH